ncbi:MAG TPA: gliding motility-associated C-terminal domain-containing protein, partial [Bacteroidia bacterium]|nr:gliding motility-associated C-terminal domain-containing protein [Bacteroidia bacterium]
DTASVTVNIIPLPVASVSGTTMICQGDSAELNAGGGGSYAWNTGATSSTIYVSASGNYFVIVSNSCGSDTAQINVAVNSVNALFSADTLSGSPPLTVNFTDNSSPGTVSWQWNFGDNTNGSGSSVTHVYTDPGSYTVTLTVTDANGCSDTYSVTILVNDVPSWVSVPNIFTPNGDGTNDVFLVNSAGLKEMKLEVYDRWGVLVNTISTPAMGWDGRTTSGVQATDGTYYYVLNATGYDNKNYSMTGFITLLR